MKEILRYKRMLNIRWIKRVRERNLLVVWAWGKLKFYNIFKRYFVCGKICVSGTGLLNPSRKCKLFERNYVRTCVEMRREEKPTRCHWMFYCTYNMLNIFRVLLCPSSGAQDCMCVITAYGVRCLDCWLLEVRCRAAGYVSRKRDVARLQSCNIPLAGHIACCPVPDLQQPATNALHTIGGNNIHISSSSWWWA